MTTSLDDKTILAGCLKGQWTAQEAFVRRFSNLVYASIQGVAKSKAIMLSAQDKDDLHSAVFVLLFEHRCRKLRQFKGKNGCTLATWIRMIAVRAVLDHLRHRKDALARPERVVSLDMICEPAQTEPSAMSHLVADEQKRLIEESLQTLSARDQLMIRMHCLESRPLSQVAQVLRLSATNVHSVKHRAIARLKKAVDSRIDKPGEEKSVARK
ncbi:MAG: sigma-70 family RNA polymerase sigma factor [Desulfobacteraceae bacterium]|jgi:RNA polymerase sigma factor (sigma-70 family)